MKYLVIDASLNGTGIRDYYEGGYVAPEDLHLSSEVIQRLSEWLQKYRDEHFNGYVNEGVVKELDHEGKEIGLLIKEELREVKLEYFSDARLTKEVI